MSTANCATFDFCLPITLDLALGGNHFHGDKRSMAKALIET